MAGDPPAIPQSLFLVPPPLRQLARQARPQENEKDEPGTVGAPRRRGGAPARSLGRGARALGRPWNVTRVSALEAGDATALPLAPRIAETGCRT